MDPFKNFIIVKSIDVITAACASILWMARWIANVKDVHIECHPKIPAYTSKVSHQLDSIADGSTKKSTHWQNQHTQWTTGMV